MRYLFRLLMLLFAGVLVFAGATACSSEEAADGVGVALPGDFPKKEVPLIDGTIQSVESQEQGWLVTVQAPATDADAYPNAIKKLTDAGFAESSRTETEQQHTVLLYREVDGKTYWVNVAVSATAAAGPSAIIYTITVT